FPFGGETMRMIPPAIRPGAVAAAACVLAAMTPADSTGATRAAVADGDAALPVIVLAAAGEARVRVAESWNPFDWLFRPREAPRSPRAGPPPSTAPPVPPAEPAPPATAPAAPVPPVTETPPEAPPPETGPARPDRPPPARVGRTAN